MTEALKDSKVEWVGKIPLSWTVTKNKYCFTNKKQLVGEKWDETQLLSLTKNGVKKKDINDGGGKQPDSFSTYQYVVPNQIVMCLFDLDQSAVFSGISQYEGMISPAYKILTCMNNTIPKYISYWFDFVFQRRKFKTYSKNIRYTLDYDEFGKLPIILPPKDEQEKIADFLDEKCAEIDKLSEDIQKQIDILNDYKKSVITRAVTKGLNPNVEMKDSGVQWIGIMPSHWVINRGKFILKYLQKPTIETDGVITCFRDGEVTLRSNRREEGFTVADKEIGYQGIDIGDLVVHGMDGFAGAIGISDSRGKASPVLNVLDTAMDKKYIMYYLRSMAYSDVFLNLATGIRVRSCDLRWNKLANLEYPIPPVEEQKKISSYIENVLEATNETILAEKDLYEKLQDYKKSIIYEYVTGKKRVKGAL